MRSSRPVASRRFRDLTAPYPDLPAAEGDIVAIFAHADDELGVAGHLTTLGDRVHWIVVSDSARGFVAPFYLRGRTKAQRRWDEVCAAASALGLRPPTGLGLPDGELHMVPDLGNQLWSCIESLVTGRLGAVYTHDVCGLYGHSDHLAVYDAMHAMLAGRGIPLIAQALPRHFYKWLPLRREARGRVRAPITHKFDMSLDTQRRKAAATRAHRSQQHVFLAMMQGRSPDAFYRKYSREFFTLESP